MSASGVSACPGLQATKGKKRPLSSSHTDFKNLGLGSKWSASQNHCWPLLTTNNPVLTIVNHWSIITHFNHWPLLTKEIWSNRCYDLEIRRHSNGSQWVPLLAKKTECLGCSRRSASSYKEVNFQGAVSGRLWQRDQPLIDNQNQPLLGMRSIKFWSSWRLQTLGNLRNAVAEARRACCRW